MDSPTIRASIIREILLVKDSLTRHPRAGFVASLPGDIFLEQKSGKAFKVTQGEWSEFPLQNIPLEHLLVALRKALEYRHQFNEKRIAKLIDNSDRITEALENCSLANLDSLGKSLEEMESVRRKY